MDKRCCLPIAFLLLLAGGAFSQKIVENKVDEFTHRKVVETSWGTIVRRIGGNMIAYVKITKTDDSYTLGFRMMNINGAIDRGADLMIRMDDDSIITLHNMSYQDACTGCAATGLLGSESPGFVLGFPIPEKERAYLLLHKVASLRIYLTGGYAEAVVKKKHSAVISDELKLLN